MSKTGTAWVLFLLFLLVASLPVHSQKLTRRALFLGNSYTYVNNMPLQVATLADSAGDILKFDMYAPGGYTLGWQPIAHSTDPASMGLISQQSWDYVVLQEQSQIPAIPVLRDSCMFPGALILQDSVKASGPGTSLLFFLTWGRRFGGMQCFTPNYCSADFAGFDQMQDSLTRAYKLVADSLAEPIAPAGEAWRFVISNYGMVLHDMDHSHPNINGSYLAACVFYGSIFGKRVTGNTFTAGLLPDTALLLQQAADSIVFGNWEYWHPGGGPGTGIGHAVEGRHRVMYYDRNNGTIIIKGIHSDGLMEVFDLAGRRVASVPVEGGKSHIPRLLPGVHICRFISHDMTVTGKISVF